MSDTSRKKAIENLETLKAFLDINGVFTISDAMKKSIDFAIASLKTDEAYQLEYERTTKNDLEVDFKLKDYVSREAVRRIIKSPRTQEQMLNALNSLRNATECKAEDCINRDYTAKYVEEFANNEYVSQDEAETIYLIADGIRHIPSVLPNVHDNNVGNIDCISRADAIGSIAVECSAENLDIDYAKFLMLRRAIKALPTVTPLRPKSEWEQDHAILKAYSDGVNEVLDKIRAEIVQKHLSIVEQNDFQSGRTYAYEEVLDIIDKYKAETEIESQESEVKE